MYTLHPHQAMSRIDLRNRAVFTFHRSRDIRKVQRELNIGYAHRHDPSKKLTRK